MDCHGHSVKIPRSIPWKSTESQWKYHGSVGWKVYSVQTVEFHVDKTYETSMELGLLGSGSRFGTGLTDFRGQVCPCARGQMAGWGGSNVVDFRRYSSGACLDVIMQ